MSQGSRGVRAFLVTALAVALGLWPMCAFGQSAGNTPPGVASLTGTVTSAEGLALSGVRVVLSGPKKLATTSDQHGAFTFSNVPPGVYQLDASKPTFLAYQQADVAIAGGTGLHLSIVLQAVSFTRLQQIAHVTVSRTGANALNTSSASISDISGSIFQQQGTQQVTQVLNQTPGIITTVAPFAAQGNGAYPSAPQVPQIRGALPYETESLVDGHPISVGANGYYSPSLLNTHVLQNVEVVKGPGAMPPDINYAVGGTVNYRTLEPTRLPREALDLDLNSYGGLSSNYQLTGSTLNNKLGYALDYAIDSFPGPYQGEPQFGNAAFFSSAGTTVNGQPICGTGVTLGCPIGLVPGNPAILGDFKFRSPLVFCCNNVESQFLARTELAKLHYNFSQTTGATITYLGAQSEQAHALSYALPGRSLFAPPAGYTGSFGGLDFPLAQTSYIPRSANEGQGLFESELRTSVGSDTLQFRYYAGSDNTANATVPFGTTYSFTANAFGGLPNGPGGTTQFFNNTPIALSTRGSGQNLITSDHYSGLSGEADLPAGNNLYTLSVDRTAHSSFSQDLFEIPQLTSTPIPAGSSQSFLTFLAKASWQLTPKFNATLANYFVRYSTHFTPDGGASFEDATHSFYGPRLGLQWGPSTNLSLRAAAGSSIAPPYLALVTTQGGAPVPNNQGAATFYTQTVNNGRIEPETAFGFNLGADWRAMRDTVISTDLYRTTLHGQFLNNVSRNGTYTATSGLNAGVTLPLYLSEAENLGQSRYEGLELSVRRLPPVGVGFRLQGSLTRAYTYNIPASFYSTGAGPFTTNLGIINNINFQPSGNGYTGLSNGRVPYAIGYAELNERSRRGDLFSIGTQYYGNNNQFNVAPFFEVFVNAQLQLAPQTSLQLSMDNLTGVNATPYYDLFGGIPVPLVNGLLGSTSLLNLGPPTFHAILRHAFGGR